MTKLLHLIFVKNMWVLPIGSAVAIMFMTIFLLESDSSLLLEGRENKAREAIQAAYALAAKYEGPAPAAPRAEVYAKLTTGSAN
jgi:hypothetical protein